MRRNPCIVLLVLPLLCSCAANRPDSRPYQTVAADPRRDTESARRYNEKAKVLLAQDKLAEAEKALQAALSADAFFGPAHNNLGIVYYRQNKLYLAAWEFDLAAKCMPARGGPHNGLGLVMEYAGRLEEARTHYAQAVALEPDDLELVGNLARCQVRLGQKTPELRDMLQRILLQDSRPDWIDWARRELLTMPADGDLPASTQPLLPATRPEE